MTPLELQFLRDLRRRGQSPGMAVFVTDDWGFANSMEDIGTLMIRVRSITDLDHDWSALAGLWVILWFSRATQQQLTGAVALMRTANAHRVWYRENGRLEYA